MKNDTIFLKIEPKLKERFLKICKAEKRNLASSVLILIEKKIQESEKNDN